MAHYKRITKRTKTSKDDIITDPAPFFIEWIQENQNMVLTAVTAVLAIAIIGYGTFYYVKVSRLDAQAALYGAVASAKGEANKEADLLAYIELNSGGKLVGQARLELGGVYMRSGKYQLAAEQYDMASTDASSNSVLSEVAQMGQAAALLMAGKGDEAATKLRELADSGQFVPKQQTKIELAYALASEGKNKEAVEELQASKTAESNALPVSGLEGAIKRIGDGEVSKALTALKSAPANTDDGKITTGKIHN